jgi:hypothetical protein
MNVRQRHGTSAQIWRKLKDSNYDGNSTARNCEFRDLENFKQYIFVRQNALTVISKAVHGLWSEALWHYSEEGTTKSS